MSSDDMQALSSEVEPLRRVGVMVPKWASRRVRFWLRLGRQRRAQRVLFRYTAQTAIGSIRAADDRPVAETQYNASPTTPTAGE